MRVACRERVAPHAHLLLPVVATMRCSWVYCSREGRGRAANNSCVYPYGYYRTRPPITAFILLTAHIPSAGLGVSDKAELEGFYTECKARSKRQSRGSGWFACSSRNNTSGEHARPDSEPCPRAKHNTRMRTLLCFEPRRMIPQTHRARACIHSKL